MIKYGLVFILFLSILSCKKKNEDPIDKPSNLPAQTCRIVADVTEGGQKIMEFIYNDHNQLVGIISNGWNSDGSLLYFNKRTIQWNSKNQQTRVDFYKQNSTTQVELYSEYEYNSQGRLAAIHSFNSKNESVSHEVRQYNDKGQLIKKTIDGVAKSVGFEYDANGDLIKVGPLSSEGVIIKPNSTEYQYDVSRPAFTVPSSYSTAYGEDIVRSMFMYDFTHSVHFCKRAYSYNAFGELASDSNFQIEKSNAEGYPETISRSVSGGLKVAYQYDYNCN